MRIVIRYAIIAVLAAFILAAAAAFFMGAATITLFKENASAFLGNLLLNLVAEILGLAIGIVLAVKIASKLANDKLFVLAPRFLKLIAQLRADTKISGHAARNCVVCAVGVISEDRLSKVLFNRSDAGEEKLCRVCNLEVKTKDSPAGSMSCSYCYLPGNVWDDEELAKIKNQMTPLGENQSQ